jgi:hypothetical protein
MANRVTEAEVQAILSSYDSTIDLEPFITVANLVVTNVCVDSDACSYDADTLKEIERWVSAHYYTMDDQAIAEEKTLSTMTKYQHKIDLAFNQTKYGQAAMSIDHCGNLSQFNQRIVNGEPLSVDFNWLGQDYTTSDPDD